MRWTDKHTLIACSGLIGLVCMLDLIRPAPYEPLEEVTSVITAPAAVTAPNLSPSVAAPKVAGVNPPPITARRSASAPEISKAAVTPPAAPGSPTRATSPALERGRQLTRLLYTGQLKRVWGTFTPSVRAEWGDFAAFAAYRAQGARAYGAEMRVLGENVVRDGGLTYYTRTATFQGDQNVPWTVIFGLTPEGRVQQFGIVGARVLPGNLAGPAR